MPRNARIRCDYDWLNNLANQCGQEADRISQMLQQIQVCVENLQGGGWIGEGANKFYMEMEDVVLPALRRLIQALEDTNTGVDRIGSLFTGAEQEGSSCLARVISAAIANAPVMRVGGAVGGGMMAASGAPQGWAGLSMEQAPPGGTLGPAATQAPAGGTLGGAVGATPLPIPDPPDTSGR